MTGQISIPARLSDIVGAANILRERADLEDHAWDALSRGRLHPLRESEAILPLCVALPASTSELRKVIFLANEERVPVVTYGGGSGLMGGALSLQPGIVVDLKRMNGFLEVDRESLLARVQAGAVLEDVERELNRRNLILGHDPWTLPVATVGGAISTNSMGYRGGKYGSMGDQVLALEVVLPNGEILSTRAVPKASVGPSLKHLFIGGEGCFGVISEATLRVFPMPERRSLHAFRFSSFEEGFGAIQDIFSRGLRPALLDFGDDAAKHHDGAFLYLGFEGVKEIVEAEQKVASAICDKAGGESLSQEEAERFWRERHIIAYHFMNNRRRRRERGREGYSRDWIHVALPASRVLAFREAAKEVLAARGVTLQESGLWTQPELFSMRLSVDGDDEEARRKLQDTVDELLRLVQKTGGSMEYCHGVGMKLAPLMAEEHGYGLSVLRRIKKILDPNNIMNPGKLDL